MKKTTNAQFFFAMLIVLIIALCCSCTKRDIQPEQIILWENSTTVEQTIFINGTKEAVGLRPGESWLRGDKSWLEHTYTVVGDNTAYPILMRNTIK